MTFLIRSTKAISGVVFLLLLGWVLPINAQHTEHEELSYNKVRFSPRTVGFDAEISDRIDQISNDTAENERAREYPDPNSVMYKSLMIPGWGQIVNNQIWKVPLVYAAIGGLAYYSIYLNKRYHDYRAAYYNLEYENRSDQPFGPTPDYLQNVTSSASLKKVRNYYRNRRDFIYVTIGLAYGLNAVDAYVYAHMRSFNVSDDLSIRSRIKPSIEHRSPVVTLRFDLQSR